jgi:hypothetical protein
LRQHCLTRIHPWLKHGHCGTGSGGQASTIITLDRQSMEMDIVEKIKIALDETRILILAAQILLGFQFRGVFRDS